MQNKLIKIKTIKFWKDKNTLFLVSELGHMQIIGANLVKHVLEIPYTKKDGTQVTREEILRMKKARNVAGATSNARPPNEAPSEARTPIPMKRQYQRYN